MRLRRLRRERGTLAKARRPPHGDAPASRDPLGVPMRESQPQGRRRADLVDVHEPNPVWTYKWCEFIAPLFEPPSVYITYRELIMAQILRQLFIKYGINRNVECGINYANIVNDGNSAKMCGFWDVLKEHKYDTLISVVNRMKEYVDANK